MDHGTLVSCVVAPARLNGLLPLSIAHSFFVFLLPLFQRECEIGAGGQPLLKDALVQPEVCIDARNVQGQHLISLQQIRIEVALFESTEHLFGGWVGTEGLKHVVEVLQGGLLADHSEHVQKALLYRHSLRP